MIVLQTFQSARLMHSISAAMKAPGNISLFLLAMSLCLASGCAGRVDSQHGQGQELEEVDCKPDISDIIDYDPVTQTSARCEKMKRDRQKARECCTNDLAEAKRQLENCQSGRGVRLLDCPAPPPCDCQGQGAEVDAYKNLSADDMFFFRLTRHLVDILQNTAKVPDSGPVTAQIGVRLSNHEWKKLQSFTDGSGREDYRKADIHSILVGMTMDVFYVNQTGILEWLGEQINFKSPGIVLAAMSVVVFSLVFGVGMYSDLYWNRRFLCCFFLAVFVISLIWNWIFLYQEETIKRYRKAQQYEDIPSNCLPHQMSWSQSLSEWYRTTWTVQKDPCLDYHMLYLVDPLLDIPPSRALAFTISSFFVDPMKYAGRALSEFHAELFQNLPVWGGCLALVSFYVIAFLGLYAYIAAPRRVQREHRRLAGLRRREEREHRALKGGRRQELQYGRQYSDMEEEEDYDDHGGRRVENVAHPPTLPPRAQAAQRPSRSQDAQDLPKKQMKPATALDDLGYEGTRSGARSQDPMGPGGLSPRESSEAFPAEQQPEPGRHALKSRSSQALPVADQPAAVRPKERYTVMQQCGDEADISSLSSLEASGIQRPTRLPEGRSTRTKHSPTQTSVGSTYSGNMTAHPASERSDVESLVSSVVDPTWVNEPEGSVLRGQDQIGGATECSSPVSVDSPSDFSVLSQSPENTNSATYEFISTSGIGSIDGEEGSQSETLHENQHENDYDDDDFVVLKTETQ